MNKNIVLIDKPEGISSYDVIRNIKKDYPKGTKIGHTGTLDPFASGLLIILLGSENKRQNEFHEMKKTYEVAAVFNKETDTGDVLGKEIASDNKVLSKDDIEKEIKRSFVGSIDQVPPKFSAVHVNGKRAYDLARNNIEFELSPKKIEVFLFEITKFEFPKVSFRIECGSGTYVRSLISDLAKSLGSHAYCEKLRRTEIGEYNVVDAIKLNRS